MEEEYRGWRVVEGPGTEDTDESEIPPEEDLGVEKDQIEGEPGPLGPAPGEIPEHDGPLPIVGTDGLWPAKEE